MRVPVAQIGNESAYEFFTGLDGANNPTWSSDISERKPVWESPDGTHPMAVSYNAGLDRYMLTSVTVDRAGWMSIYDAPEPWGPWTTVLVEQNTDRWGGDTASTGGPFPIIFSFVNKWMSDDGKDFVLVYTLNDQWASIEGSFTTY